MKKAVQQTLISDTKQNLAKEGITEYICSRPEASDSETEEREDNSDKGVANKNPGSNSAPHCR